MSDKVQVEPMAAVNLLSAEREFYRNRCLFLENEVVLLRRQVEAATTAPNDAADEQPTKASKAGKQVN